MCRFQTNNVVAQDLLNSSDLSTLKVDSLSDADIAKIKPSCRLIIQLLSRWNRWLCPKGCRSI
jgi:hypothetical protein